MKTKIGIGLLILFLLYVCGQTGYLLYKATQKNNRLENDIHIGTSNGSKIVDYYKAKNGDLVARNAVLEYSKKELVNNIDSAVIASLNNLGIKPKNVINYSSTVIQHDKEIVSKVHDSTIFDTVKVQVFKYTDKWYNIQGLKIGEDQHLKISSVDSIVQVVYKGSRYGNNGKKLPGICFWRPRRLEQVISSNNPDSKIIFSKTITVVK